MLDWFRRVEERRDTRLAAAREALVDEGAERHRPDAAALEHKGVLPTQRDGRKQGGSEQSFSAWIMMEQCLFRSQRRER